MLKKQNNTKKEKSNPCIYCGWAMGEKEGEPLCDRCGKKIKKETK